MKIYELAKELNVATIELIDELKIYGINVKNHMESISKSQIDLFQEKKKNGLTVQKEEELKRKEKTLLTIEKIKASQETEDQKVIENFPKECEKFVLMLKRIFDQGHPLSESSNEIYEMWEKFERKNKAALKQKKKIAKE